MKHIVIIGGGFSGLLLNNELKDCGFKVTLIEKGNHVNLDKKNIQNLFDRGINPFDINPATKKSIICRNKLYNPNSYRQFTLGGTWEIACGNAVRLDEDDFCIRKKYGYAKDWPITYSELEPYYQKTEKLMGVSGSNDLNYSKRWRSENFPLPAFPYSESDKVLINGCRKLNINVLPMPQARNSIPYHNDTVCIGSNTCFPFCPTGAKFSALTRLYHNKNLIITNSSVYDVSYRDKKFTVKYIDIHNNKNEIKSDICILASGSIENSRILLMSKNLLDTKYIKFMPIGKFFMEHPQISLHGYFKEDLKLNRNYPLQTARIDDFADITSQGKSRFVIEFNNHPPISNFYTPSIKIKKILDENQINNKYVRVNGIVEQLPNEQNRVALSKNKKDYYGLPIPILDYQIDNDSINAIKNVQHVIKDIFNNSNIIQDEDSPVNIGFSGHQMGTTCMGNSKEDSVVDKNCQVFGCEDLFIVGSSVFPTSGLSNPTLTIGALCIRLSDFIKKNY